MIKQRNISLLCNRLARDGGRRIPEAIIERDYCLAWFLSGLSLTPLREQLIFKGGTALKRCYFGDYRFSEDLDFTLKAELELDAILESLKDVYDKVHSASGIVFQFARQDRKQHRNSHTFYIAYEGPLPSTTPKEVKVDITISERLVCPLQERAIVKGYDEYTDLPEDSFIQVYALDEIAVEKFAALTDRARNEPRDLYDLWYLTSEKHVDLSMLIPEIEQKLAFRDRSRKGVNDELARKEPRFKKLWDTRLSQQMSSLPPFEDVFRSVCRTMRAAELL